MTIVSMSLTQQICNGVESAAEEEQVRKAMVKAQQDMKLWKIKPVDLKPLVLQAYKNGFTGRKS